MDDYDLSDYVQHSVGYFIQKLDEHGEEPGRAMRAMNLMQMQFEEYHGIEDGQVDGETIEVFTIQDDQKYHPLYDFVARMYYDKYVSEEMADEEAEEVARDLIMRLSNNVPSKYNVTWTHFMDYLEEYRAERA